MVRAVLRFVLAAALVASASVAIAQSRGMTDGYIGAGSGSASPGQLDRTMEIGGG